MVGPLYPSNFQNRRAEEFPRICEIVHLSVLLIVEFN